MEIKERSPSAEAAKKFTLRLGVEAVSDIEWIARQYGGITTTEVLKRALATEMFLLKEQKNGEVVVLENKQTGRQREIVLR